MVAQIINGQFVGTGSIVPGGDAPVMPAPTPTTTSSPSVISSQKGADIVGQKTQTLNQLTSNPAVTYNYNNGIATPAGTPTNTTKTSTTAAPPPTTSTKVTLINPKTDQTVTYEDAAINKENIQGYLNAGYTLSEASGALPSWLTPNGTNTPQTPEQKAQAEADQASADLKSLTQNLGQFMVTDAALQAQVSGISATWDARIADMQKINEQRKGSINTLGIRLGSRYAGGSGGTFGGIVSEEERQGVVRIGDLEGQKQAAISAARTAALTQNWSVYSKQIDIAEKAYEQKVQAVADLQKAAADQNKLIADSVRQQEKDHYDQVTKPINDILTSAAKNNAPKEVQDAIANATDLAGAVAAAGSYLQDVPTGGIVGEYLFYKKQQEAAGQKAVDFNAYQNMDANRKIKIAAAGQNPDRILSVTEAQALNMPFGTTASQAYGKTALKPPTESQSKDAAFAQRTSEANEIIKNLESTIGTYNPLQYMAETAAEPNSVGNTFVSDTIRQVRQAERNFLNAILRRESGASISPSEFANGEKQYFPRPGDDEKTLAQKAQNRQTQISGLIKSAGPTYGIESSVPSTADSLKQTEAQAQQIIIDYGNKNPAAQDSIRKMIQDGKTNAEIRLILNI